MRIGTDVNLWTCRAEGYMMMDYKKRELFKKGILQKDCCCRFFATMGYISHNNDGNPLYPGMPSNELYKTDTVMSWNDLWEIYLKHKNSIDSMCGYENSDLYNENNPSEYDLLNLASDIDSYCGLE